MLTEAEARDFYQHKAAEVRYSEIEGNGIE